MLNELGRNSYRLMTAFPTICNQAADQEFQQTIREQYPKTYEFEARYVDHEMAHVGHLFSTGTCPVDGKQVLEFGCNIGATSIVLSHYGAQVTAVEVNPTTMSIARLNARRYGNTAIRFELLTEGEPLPFPDAAFDVISCNSVLEYVRPDLLPAVQRELNRVLKPGGLILVWGTSNRLSPIEMHSHEWFNNYIPRRFDRDRPRPRERGVTPWRLRRGFGPGYDNLFAGRAGMQRYIELKQMMGVNGRRLKLLGTLGGLFAISPVSLPLILPYSSLLLQKRANGTTR